ncbi:receptor-type protein kinase, putative [Bodo saltans]|uniref:Receptor-type protein kinase, putative n=1 Tax=Bodo saltans TaxID=75058 RepID=A0A0S4IK76_BODSA|nr:receptor-type protein kinase, putative [Bodo saltans]|eukprot:CUE62036.1 receptor-type protein kinase, putative [Bodo saltans]
MSAKEPPLALSLLITESVKAYGATMIRWTTKVLHAVATTAITTAAAVGLTKPTKTPSAPTAFAPSNEVTDGNLSIRIKSHSSRTRMMQEGGERTTTRTRGASHSLQRLRQLKVCSFRITDAGLAHISSAFRELRQLNLSWCQRITDKGVSSLSWQHLEMIDLTGTAVTEASIELLAMSSPHLRRLELSRCTGTAAVGAVGGVGVSKLASFFELNHLALDYFRATAEGECLRDVLMALSNLTFLDCGNCLLVTDGCLEVAASLQHLRHLELCSCGQITDAGLLHMFAPSAKVTQLRHLDKSGCRAVTNAGLAAAFASLTTSSVAKQLRHLTLSSTNITDNGVMLIATAMPQLTELCLSGCAEITDSGVMHVSTFLLELTLLDVSWCDAITDGGLSSVSSLQQLQHLDLSWSSGFTDVGLAQAASSLRHLQYLNLDSCHITDDGIAAALSSLLHVKTLYLGSCDVTDVSLRVMSNFLMQLESLDVSKCDQITDVGLQSLASLPFLEVLQLAECGSITDACLRSFESMHQLIFGPCTGRFVAATLAVLESR